MTLVFVVGVAISAIFQSAEIVRQPVQDDDLS